MRHRYVYNKPILFLQTENTSDWNSSEADPEIESVAGARKLFLDGAKEIQLNETNSIKIKTKFNFRGS